MTGDIWTRPIRPGDPIPNRLGPAQEPPFDEMGTIQLCRHLSDVRLLKPRISENGTYWCLGCPTPIEPTRSARLCKRCARLRSVARRKRNRAATKEEPSTVSGEVDAGPQDSTAPLSPDRRVQSAVADLRAMVNYVADTSDDRWGSACENCTDLSKSAETLLSELERAFDL